MGLTSYQKIGSIISGIGCLNEQEKLNLIERLAKENIELKFNIENKEFPKGYIMMGCFGSYFSEDKSSYDCDLCGVHWIEAEINNFNDLKDYALLKSVGELIYDIDDESDFWSSFREDEDWLQDTYLSTMNLVLDEYFISDNDFYKMSFWYWNKQKKEKE